MVINMTSSNLQADAHLEVGMYHPSRTQASAVWEAAVKSGKSMINVVCAHGRSRSVYFVKMLTEASQYPLISTDWNADSSVPSDN